VAVLPTTRDECTFYDEKEKSDEEEKCDLKECDDSRIFSRDEMSVEVKKMRKFSAPSLTMTPSLGFGWAIESQMKKVGPIFFLILYTGTLDHGTSK